MLARLRPFLVVAGLVASIALTYLAFRDIDFEAFLDALAGGDPAWYLASFAVFLAAYALRVVRWRILFEPGARPPYRAVARALLVGEFLTTLMPALRLGELGRVVVLHREARASRAVAIGTVVTERLQDAVVLLLLLFAAVPFAPTVSWLRGATVALAVLATGLVVTAFALGRFGSRPISFALRPLASVPGFSRARSELAAAGVARGLGGLRNARIAIVSLALTSLSWLAIAFSFALALRGVGIELGLDAGILVAVATTFSLLLPSLPASVGIFEAATLVALDPYGVDDERALSGAVVIHVLSFVPFLLVGPLALRGHAAIVRREQLRAAGSGNVGGA